MYSIQCRRFQHVSILLETAWGDSVSDCEAVRLSIEDRQVSNYMSPKVLDLYVSEYGVLNLNLAEPEIARLS